jgi:hypothetical protein
MAVCTLMKAINSLQACQKISFPNRILIGAGLLADSRHLFCSVRLPRFSKWV